MPSPRDSETFTLPQSWQDQIVTKFERLETSPFPEEGASSAYDKDPKTWRDKCLPKYSALLHLLECTSVRPSTTGPVSDMLLRKLKLALRPSLSLATDEARFIVSQGFSAYLRMRKAAGPVDKSLRPLLRAAAPRYSSLTGFLEAMLAYEEQVESSNSASPQNDSSESPDKEDDPLLKSLIANLSSPSSALRLASLRLLDRLDTAPDQLDTLATMLQTEHTPLDIQNVRGIGVHLRKLGAAYAQLADGSWLRQAVPSFLFGMMTVKLTPVWDTAVEALKQIGQTSSGEEVICEKAFAWLDVPSLRWGPGGETAGPQRQGTTDFECHNLAHLYARGEDTKQILENTADLLLESFGDSQRPAPAMPENARSQALKVMTATPQLFEKRSRRLVPIFLAVTTNDEEQPDSPEAQSAQPDGASWSLPDRKAFTNVFSLFVNPRVIFQHQKVYESLLNLLANGDLDIQKASLKAILAWKQEGVKPYRENLEYLLDEARFKNELTVLFQGDNQIQPEHRAEMMPVLLRLLYGRTISKKGVASGRGGLQATRLAVLRSLSVEDLGAFLDIALGDLRGIEVVGSNGVREDVFAKDILTVRKQVGFLNMVSAMINELGSSVEAYAGAILNAVMYCLVLACRRLRSVSEEADEEEGEGHTSLLRNVRTISLKCVVSLLRNAPTFNWMPYKDIIIKEVVSPRLENFAVENAQSISGTLQLLSTLALIPETALFLAVDERIIPKLTECLLNGKAKDDVRIFALGIIRDLVKLSQAPATESEYNELIEEELLNPNLELILERIGLVLRPTTGTEKESGKGAEIQLGRDLLAACVDAVVELSPIVQESKHAPELIDISVFLLNQPSRRVNPKVKGAILTVLQNFLQLDGVGMDQDLRRRIYATIASLFVFFKDRPNRQSLCKVLTVFADKDHDVLETASLCTDLNSFVEGRIDEPDYEKRLSAYSKLSKPRETPFTIAQWEPILYNLLFFIKHDEEYGILSANSADCICRFVDATIASTPTDKSAYDGMLSDTVLPAIFSGAREPSEIVRREVVRVLGYMVAHRPSWAPVSDLVGLDPPPDEKDSDPSFFSHILSPTISRQLQAMQLLSKVNYHTELSSKNLAHFFIPLLEHFIFGRPDGTDDHGVGAQATTTIAELAISLEWPQFRAILRRYIGYVEAKPEAQKQLIRLLGKVIDSLTQASSERSQDTMEIDEVVASRPAKKHMLTKTMPAPEKFNEDIAMNILPSMVEYIHEKDEALVSSRVPVGIIIVKILKLLPTQLLEQKLPGVLSDICQILRSKAWESREMARDSLAKMSALLGPSCFGFVLDELRRALTKGYQLHVLSYTMHTILVNVIPRFAPGDLDYCLDKIVAVVMDDIFGATGQEKDAEEYTSKMKEVKSSKSQDSMELVSRTTSIDHLVELVQPLQSLLLEKLDLKMVRKIDELLTRIANGLLGNAAAESQDTLVFCYEVIKGVYESEKPQTETKLDPKVKRYLVQKGAKRSGDRGSTSKYTYKLVRFAFDILRSVFKKHDSLRNARNIAGFIPILGDAVTGGEEEVKIAAFKLLTVIVKVPFKTDESSKLYKVAAKDATKSISMSTSTGSDVAQAALKLISVVLRDRRDVEVKNAAIDMLLGRLKDDLTEPLYRHVTFNFLRSVLDRRVETAAVYDTLDYVGTIMITNDDKDTRDLARGAFFQFLRDYPQKKNRWAKQLKFVVANLDYEREGGRLSVMEVIHLLLRKSADDFVQEVASSCFIPLVLRVANDDSEQCRLAAGELVKDIFRKADKERTSKFLSLPRGWLEQDEDKKKLPVLRLAIQTFGLYFEAKEASPRDEGDMAMVVQKIVELLDDYADIATDYELVNTIVQTVPVLLQNNPGAVLSNEALWHGIGKPLTSPDATVKLSSINLLNIYLDDFYRHSKEAGGADAMVGSHGLQLDKAAIQALVVLAVGVLSPSTIARWRKRMAKKTGGTTAENEALSMQQLPTDLDEGLAAQVVLTLERLAKFLDPKPTATDKSAEAGEEEQEEQQSEVEEAEEEWGGVDEPEEASPVSMITLHTLFNFLSDILATEAPARSTALVPKVAAMKLLHYYVSTLPAAALEPSLNMLLTPLHHMTDPNITVPATVDDTFKVTHDGLRTKAEESMDVLQRKMGTEAYTRELLAIREAARKRREGRARKRKIEAVTAPEKYGKWKQGRLEKKVKRRKERKGEQRERRHGARY